MIAGIFLTDNLVASSAKSLGYVPCKQLENFVAFLGLRPVPRGAKISAFLLF